MRPFGVVLALTLGAPLAAAAEPIPPPTGVLRDFVGRGFIQVEIPPAPDVKTDEKLALRGTGAGLGMVVEFRQAFVRPDCYLMEMLFSGIRQISRGLGSTERTYVLGSPYLQERTYRNVDPKGDSPLQVVRSSMVTYGKLFGELGTGKLLPQEDLVALKADLLRRLDEVSERRKKLKESTDPADVPRANKAAGEHARLRDELEQIDVRRAHPCHIVEFRNRDVVQSLTERKMLGGIPPDLLVEGRTRVWLTREEGLPLKIEITENGGEIALYCILREVSINMGLKPGDLALGIPPGAQIVSATVDAREPDWEDRIEEAISKQLARLESIRQAKTRDQPGLYLPRAGSKPGLPLLPKEPEPTPREKRKK